MDLSSVASSSFGFQVFKISTCFIPRSSIVFVRFSKDFPKGESVNLACSIIWFWLDDNISSPVRYSYLPILPDDKADILGASLLLSYCSFLSSIWSLIVLILLYVYFKDFFLNLKGLSDGKVVSWFSCIFL